MSIARASHLVLCAAVLGAVGTVSAQDFDIGLTGPQCDSIVANALSNPARRDTLGLVRNCPGSFDSVMTTLLSQTGRVSTDLDTYIDIVDMAGQFKESGIFSEAVALAGNGSAPDMARIGAMVIVLQLTSPFPVSFPVAWFVGYRGPATGCFPMQADTDVVYPGEHPLPSDAGATALTLAQSLTNSGPAAVRYLASCIIRTRTKMTGYGSSAAGEHFDSSTDYEYTTDLCSRNLSLRNKSNAWVSIRVEARTQSGVLLQDFHWSLPPRPEGQAYSETTWNWPINIGGQLLKRIYVLWESRSGDVTLSNIYILPPPMCT